MKNMTHRQPLWQKKTVVPHGNSPLRGFWSRKLTAKGWMNMYDLARMLNRRWDFVERNVKKYNLPRKMRVNICKSPNGLVRRRWWVYPVETWDALLALSLQREWINAQRRYKYPHLPDFLSVLSQQIFAHPSVSSPPKPSPTSRTRSITLPRLRRTHRGRLKKGMTSSSTPLSPIAPIPSDDSPPK